MTAKDILLALNNIDDELLEKPVKAIKFTKKRKIFVVLVAAAMVIMTLCAFGYATSIETAYENGVLEISIAHPMGTTEVEECSLGYLAVGYEITQLSDKMWCVSNGSSGFYFTRLCMEEQTTAEVETLHDGVIDEIEILENIAFLTEEYIEETRFFYWKSRNYVYSVSIFGRTGEEAELVAMIQSITP